MIPVDIELEGPSLRLKQITMGKGGDWSMRRSCQENQSSYGNVKRRVGAEIARVDDVRAVTGVVEGARSPAERE